MAKTKKERFKHQDNILQRYSEVSKTWSFVVYIRYEDQNGMPQNYTKTFSEKKCGSARTAYDCAVADRDQFVMNKDSYNPTVKKKNVSIQEVFEEFSASSELTSESLRKKRIAFNKWIDPSIRGMKLSKLTPQNIQTSLSDAVKMGASEGIIQDLMTIWKQICRQALRSYYIVNDPMNMVDRPKVSKKESSRKVKRSVNTDTLQSVFEALTKHYDVYTDEQTYNTEIIIYAIKLMFLTGIRPAECFALERQHINLFTREISIEQSIYSRGRNTADIKGTKTRGSVRTIPMTDECYDLVAELLRFTDHQYLFSDFKGKLQNSNKVSNVIYQRCKREGVQFNMYCLRHNLATTLLHEGTNIKTVQEIMGHASGAMTLSYAESVGDSKKNALNNLKLASNVTNIVTKNLQS